MKLLKFLPLFALLFIYSCNDAEKKETDDMDDMAEQAEIRDPAESNKQWIDSWNSNDVATLDSLTSSSAVLYMEGGSMSSDSIRAWYKNAAPMMKALKTQPEANYSGKDIAYEAGTYSYQIKGDSLNNTYNGAYTLIWKKTNNDWKLQVMNITDKASDSTATEMEEE
ncbi:nuclear transport factor 2 family protein [Christiangramia forsetii]|uniref:DUF4440 domain-containing protein n=2 Tax=Christiangramia forsetii TaxID=411153 RepID=A0M5X2_CHRFK|nr:nuclear transport factor 2 family protein [Christiangramia forsetii]GGG31991.1 hypothetical protein GCM10011532_14330 [Christiangramia forsetii]CAL68017.1 hypothetical protein GFO_3073 [Christiangramia forsetii KT0803]